MLPIVVVRAFAFVLGRYSRSVALAFRRCGTAPSSSSIISSSRLGCFFLPFAETGNSKRAVGGASAAELPSPSSLSRIRFRGGMLGRDDDDPGEAREFAKAGAVGGAVCTRCCQLPAREPNSRSQEGRV